MKAQSADRPQRAGKGNTSKKRNTFKDRVQRLNQGSLLLVRALMKSRREDLTSSQRLCECVGLDFTVFVMCLPISHLVEQANELKKLYAKKFQNSNQEKRKKKWKKHHEKAHMEKLKLTKAMTTRRTTTVNHLLSLERCLGTAAVHAFLNMNSCLPDKVHLAHVTPAESLPWQCPPGKDFLWFRSVFQEMIAMGRKPGWYLRSRLFTLIFMQATDGHFKLSQELADILWVGKPAEPPGSSMAGSFDLQALHRSMPLKMLLGEEGEEEMKVAGREERLKEAESVWATLLASALYTHLPLTWVTNPTAPPNERTTLGHLADTWLEADARQDHIRGQLPELSAMATKLVVQWDEDHINRLEELHKWMPSYATVSDQQPPWWKRTYNWTAQSAFWIVSSHPLVAIYLVKPSEAFSRSERLVVQMNVFIIMLSFCMFFYYSRAMGCCEEFKDYVGCPPAGLSDCFAQPTCQTLFAEKTGDSLPEELEAADFVCTAFPTTSWMDRIWSVLIINAALIPVNVFLMSLFSLSGASAGALGHLSMDLGKKSLHSTARSKRRDASAGREHSKRGEADAWPAPHSGACDVRAPPGKEKYEAVALMGPQRGAALTNFFLVLYAVFFDIKLLTKTMAMLFMAIFAMLFQPVKAVTKFVRPILNLMLPIYIFIADMYNHLCW
ncbi:hypothetical protein CYMTET_13294 [Cymbomonas tetramitiformis]|uniref:Uncharacterized protein n=1 Tax=Cymbomonas tetramitiformis TaxID=36881 RepID=A0AAE0GIF8_9CHLO|nr:hypothetical protein CYMTET_13294 [Cymbomonas tetramitiformis]